MDPNGSSSSLYNTNPNNHLHHHKPAASPPVTPSSSTFSSNNQHHHSSTSTTTSSDATHHTRARSHSHSFHQNNNTTSVNNSKNSNHHGSIPITAASSVSQTGGGGSGGLGSSGSSTASSSGLIGSAAAAAVAAVGVRSMPSLKINMHQHSHHLDQFSRSITARTRRFFRTYFSKTTTTTSNNNLSTTSSSFLGQFTAGRRLRLRIVIPVVIFGLWLFYIINAFLFRLFFGGSKDNRHNPNEPIQPPTWLDRGDITDLDLRPTEGANMMTAVLLNWSRLDSLKDIVEHLCPHIMFKEIMIWNNKVDIHIEEKVNEWAFDYKARSSCCTDEKRKTHGWWDQESHGQQRTNKQSNRKQLNRDVCC